MRLAPFGVGLLFSFTFMSQLNRSKTEGDAIIAILSGIAFVIIMGVCMNIVQWLDREKSAARKLGLQVPIAVFWLFSCAFLLMRATGMVG